MMQPWLQALIITALIMSPWLVIGGAFYLLSRKL